MHACVHICLGDILNAMWKAREKNCCIKVRYGKILFCGANGAGKTNFLNLLLDEEFSSAYVSTEVVKPQQTTIAMKVQASKYNKDNELIFKKLNIDDEIFELMKYLPKEYTSTLDQQDNTSCNQKRTLPNNQKSNQQSANEENTKSTDEKVTQYQTPTFAEEFMIGNLASGNFTSEVHKVHQHDKVWDILTFMDTGGQPQYISMLPAVNSFSMITFIVHKMTGGRKSLDDKFMVQHGNKEGKPSFTPYEHECTYYQLIKTLMSYASVNYCSDKLFLSEFKFTYGHTHGRSISFIGTHSEDVSETDINEIDEALINIVKNSNSKNITLNLNETYNYLVPIDNKTQSKRSSLTDINGKILKSPSDTEEQNTKRYTNPSKICTYIYELMKKQDTYDVPIQWLLLELEIRKVCESKQCSFITCDDVLKIGREKRLGNDNFIKTGLRFHHLFGVLLYFEEVKGMSELVITDHQWLFEKLSEIVKYSFKADITSEYQYLCKGIFEKSMLSELNIDKDFEKSGIDTKFINPTSALLELLQHLLIIVRLNEDDSKYFMPSLLQSCNLTDQTNIPGEKKIMGLTGDPEALLIQFESDDATSSFPRGVLCFLVVQLIRSTNWNLYTKNVHHNLLTFFKVNDGYYVTLIDKIFFLEVYVTHESTDMAPIHFEVFETIKIALSVIKKRLSIKVILKYGFLCKMCEDTKEVHMTYLPENNYNCLSENNCNYCYCADEKATKLNSSHKVWLPPSAMVSACIYTQITAFHAS